MMPICQIIGCRREPVITDGFCAACLHDIRRHALSAHKRACAFCRGEQAVRSIQSERAHPVAPGKVGRYGWG